MVWTNGGGDRPCWLVAGLVSLMWLSIRREPFPKEHWKSLLWVVGGVILGFPWFSAWAMARVPASHGAVMLALLPLATAGAGTWRAHERPSMKFWGAAFLGSAILIAYALMSGAGHLRMADGALLGAVLCAGLGYAEGGRLARMIGGWRVISWALVVALPLTVPTTVLAVAYRSWASIPVIAWASLLYVALGSQWLAFFAWYQGLALGGVARIGQIQYLQVFFTLIWSYLWLGEAITGWTYGVAIMVVLTVIWGKSAPVRGPREESTVSVTSEANP